MMLSGILGRQWNGYSEVHSSPLNMIIHIVSVPVFVLGTLSLFVSLIELSPIGMLISILVVVIAFGAQGFGHSKERISPESFATPGQAIVRILSEQFITFPRYVLSGGWYATYQSSAAQRR